MKNDLIMSGYFYSGISNCFVLRDAASTLEPCTRAVLVLSRPVSDSLSESPARVRPEPVFPPSPKTAYSLLLFQLFKYSFVWNGKVIVFCVVKVNLEKRLEHFLFIKGLILFVCTQNFNRTCFYKIKGEKAVSVLSRSASEKL